MKIAVVQTNPSFGETERNLDAMESTLQPHEADVFVLPELFNTGYLFTSTSEVAALAEPVGDGPTVSRLLEWAKAKNCAIAAGFAEATPDGPYNSAILVGPDGILSLYRKIHLFQREKLWFLPGNRSFEVIEFRGARLGLMVCFDWRFPESTRTLAFLGADVVLHPSNLVLPWCPEAMIFRSLENHVFTATANRWGVEERDGFSLRYIGRSQLVTPMGERLGQIGEEEDGVLVTEIDPAAARDKQVSEHNNLWGDRRRDFYVADPAVVPTKG